MCKVLAKPHRATPTNYKHEIIIAEFEIIAARAQQLFMELSRQKSKVEVQ